MTDDPASLTAPPESLETLLGSRAEDFESRRTLLRAFVYARVYVLADREIRPLTRDIHEAHMTLVSDGPNKEQPMLAVFSTRERAERFLQETGGGPHLSEIDSVFALVCTPEKAGIIINPNQAENFRLAPELVAMLRERIDSLRGRGPAEA